MISTVLIQILKMKRKGITKLNLEEKFMNFIILKKYIFMNNYKLIKFLKPNLPQNLKNINIKIEDLINFAEYFDCKNKKLNLHFGVSASLHLIKF